MIPALEALILFLGDESMLIKRQLIQGTKQIIKRDCAFIKWLLSTMGLIGV